MDSLFKWLNVSPPWFKFNLFLAVAASATIGFADPPGELPLLMLSMLPVIQVQLSNETGEFSQRLVRILLAGLINISVIVTGYSHGRWWNTAS